MGMPVQRTGNETTSETRNAPGESLGAFSHFKLWSLRDSNS